MVLFFILVIDEELFQKAFDLFKIRLGEFACSSRRILSFKYVS